MLWALASRSCWNRVWQTVVNRFVKRDRPAAIMIANGEIKNFGLAEFGALWRRSFTALRQGLDVAIGGPAFRLLQSAGGPTCFKAASNTPRLRAISKSVSWMVFISSGLSELARTPVVVYRSLRTIKACDASHVSRYVRA